VDGGFVDQVGVPFSSDHTHISCFDSTTAPAPGAASNAHYEWVKDRKVEMTIEKLDEFVVRVSSERRNSEIDPEWADRRGRYRRRLRRWKVAQLEERPNRRRRRLKSGVRCDPCVSGRGR
jgi:hypothetical protein